MLCFALITAWSIHFALSIDCSEYSEFSQCNDELYCRYNEGSCRCNSQTQVNILFTISTSAYIGEDNFNNILKPWLKNITNVALQPNGLSQIGFNIFSDSSTLYPIEYRSYDTINNLIDNNVEYDGGSADLSEALYNTITAFEDTNNDYSRLNIIIMGSNPYSSQSDVIQVCQQAASIKQMGINVLFVGIGNSWKQARIDCLVSNISTNIISIDSFNIDSMNNKLSTIINFICNERLNIKITEIKPMTSITQNARFIEFYNNGRRIETSNTLIFNGLLTGSITGYHIIQGQYFVIYNPDDGGISCNTCIDDSQCTVNVSTGLCNEATYISCGSSDGCTWDDSMTVTDWNINIMDESSNLIDSLSYNLNEYWQVIQNDYSYTLQYVGYNNKLSSNWLSSCNIYGTPGSNTRICNSTELLCTSQEGQCTLTGDDSATCSSVTFNCLCNIGYYPSGGSCLPIPEASNCITYIVTNNSITYTRFEFDAAPIDGNEQYQITYKTSPSTSVIVKGFARIRNENDVYFIPDITHINGYVQTVININNIDYVSREYNINCSIRTQNPTVSPTNAPTNAPTLAPTNTPTYSPTWQTPKVYLSGDFCNNDRCWCYNKDFDCCLNGLLDSINCTKYSLDLTVGLNTQIFNTIKIYPETFPYSTKICWNIKFNTTIAPYRRRRLLNNDTNSKTLGITVKPMEGCSIINGTSSVRFETILNESDIICPDNNTDCIKDFMGYTALFELSLINCTTFNIENTLDDCELAYPYMLYYNIERSDTGNGGDGTSGEDKIDTWIWILLAGCLVFALLLGWLLYRYWYKGKKQDTEYNKIGDDIVFQTNQNEMGLVGNLDNPDIKFNPLATGIPGVDAPNDPLGVERDKRKDLNKNDMVEPNAIKEVFREEMGQVVKQSTKSSGIKQPLLGD